MSIGHRTRIGLFAVWLLAAVAGAWFLAGYENEAGRAGQTLEFWPQDSKIVPPQDRPILLMFAHPQCPCTRTSITELNRLLARCNADLSVQIHFIQPAALPHDWTQTDLWKSASAIPGVTVAVDLGGEEARRFGAESSGYVVLYDQHGNLAFNGGVTVARAHAGDNAGANRIVSLVNGLSGKPGTAPVFGCGMFEEDAVPESWTKR